MNKFVVSLVALFATTSAFASEPLTINVNNLQAKVVKKSEGPAFSAKSFAGAPVVNHNGQIVGVDLAVLVDGEDENVAVLRPLGEYKVAGVKVSTVFAASVDARGNNVYAGGGVLVPLGSVVPGFDLKVGAVVPGANLSSGGRLDTRIVPAFEAKIRVPELFGEAKSLVNKVLKTVSPVGVKV
jgi:hypothetical protein